MEETLGPIDAAVWKVALRMNHESICSELRCKEFCLRLYERLLLTPEEHERLQKRERNEGEIAQCRDLLECVEKKLPSALWEILEELKIYKRHIYAVIEKTAQEIINGSANLPSGWYSFQYLHILKHRICDLFLLTHLWISKEFVIAVINCVCKYLITSVFRHQLIFRLIWPDDLLTSYYTSSWEGRVLLCGIFVHLNNFKLFVEVV